MPCRVAASGHPLFVKGHRHSNAPYEDMQTSLQLNSGSKRAAMTRS
jgi:hypothetical protein